jgi:hypothetical protein
MEQVEPAAPEAALGARAGGLSYALAVAQAPAPVQTRLLPRLQNFSAQPQHLDPGVKGEKMHGGYNT